jgi:beta-glucanase (GH16 family)
MSKAIIILTLLVILLSACATTTPTPIYITATPAPSPTPVGERTGWNLVWSDEFNGDQLDRTNWAFDLGANGWGNAEMEEYTNSTDNVRVENGQLIIEARKDDKATYGYSSARIKTQGLHTWQYGRVEARLKLPSGQGIWPAFWMLGDGASWPGGGEIDIMEMIGKQPNTIYTTMHGPGYSGAKGIGSHIDLPDGSLQNDFHIYAVEWEPNEIRWYVDDNQIFKVSSTDVPGKWVFDHPFFIIMNVAVGGGWPGFPDSSTIFPQQMLVDYLRVYQRP